MGYNEQLTKLMGPAAVPSASMSRQVLNTPIFCTNVTSKYKYRENWRRWIRPINSSTSTDSKYQAFFNAAGHVIYALCNDTAQSLIRQSELMVLINMDGDEDGNYRFQLVRNIVDTISKNSSYESIWKAVNQLTDISICEKMSSWARI